MNTSPYAQVGEKLIDNGYSAIPIRPGTKLPGSLSFGKWYGQLNWQEYCKRQPTKYEAPLWAKWPDAGVCVTLGWAGLIAIDIDTDDAEITAAILRTLPESPVAKKGHKGKTLFYRGSPEIKSLAFNVGGERALDLLAFGRQTILPPTLHATTGQSYVWLTEDTLVDTPPDKLPLLPDDIAEKLAEALDPFGYVPLTSGDGTTIRTSGETLWREVKDNALANLSAWVPALGLPKTRPHGSQGYRAVPVWRPSSTGRSIASRGANLSFHRDGIKDMGDGQKYSAIDVVMHTFSYDIHDATEWLQEKLGYEKPTNDFDHKSFIERNKKKKHVEPSQELAEPAGKPATPVNAPRGTMDPFDPKNAGGLLGAIASFTIDTAHRPSREFAMLAGISFISAICNRRYVTPNGFGTNIYLIGLSPPSFGKEHPQNIVKTLCFEAGMPFLLGAGEVSSGSAIEKVVRRAPNSIMIWDELGIVLQSINGARAPGHADSIRKVLLDVYSKSRHGSLWQGKETADPKKDNTPIHSPTISLLGFSTTTEFYKGLPEASLRDGFLARLLIIQARVRGERQKTKALLIPPSSLIAAIKQTADDFPKKGKITATAFRHSEQKPNFYEVPWADTEAEDAWNVIDDWQLEEIKEDAGKYGIVGRASEHTQKLATIRAVSRCPSDPMVTAEDIAWGYSFVQRSLDNVDKGVAEYMADSPHEQLCKAIMETLRASKTGAVPMSQLIRKKGISRYDERARLAALNDLVIGGEIKPLTDRKGGKTVTLANV